MKRLWLFDNSVPTRAPDGANTLNATLRLLGREVNPPVLASASEMIWPGLTGERIQVDFATGGNRARHQ